MKNAAQTGQERNNPGIDQRCVQADCSIEILKDEGNEQRLEYFKQLLKSEKLKLFNTKTRGSNRKHYLNCNVQKIEHDLVQVELLEWSYDLGIIRIRLQFTLPLQFQLIGQILALNRRIRTVKVVQGQLFFSADTQQTAYPTLFFSQINFRLNYFIFL